MVIHEKELRERYELMELDRLLKLRAGNNLTDEASVILNEVLASRGVQKTDIDECRPQNSEKYSESKKLATDWVVAILLPAIVLFILLLISRRMDMFVAENGSPGGLLGGVVEEGLVKGFGLGLLLWVAYLISVLR